MGWSNGGDRDEIPGRLIRTLVRPAVVGAAAVVSVLVPLGHAAWRNTSHHGFFHHAIVYQIFDHGLPPENPLFAGEPLRYYYGLHVVLAGLMKLVPLSPPEWFVVLNVLMIAAFVAIVDRLARSLDADGVLRACACFLALTGLDPFTRGWPASALLSTGWPIERRLFPWHKFMTVNANQVGMVVAALVLLLLVRWLDGREERHILAAIAALTLVAALVYPPAWVVVVAWIAAAALHQLAWRRSTWSAVALGAAAAAGSALAFPYLQMLMGGRLSGVSEPAGWLHFARNGVIVATVAAVGSLLAAAGWRDCRDVWSRNADRIALLSLCALASAVLYVPASFYDAAEYKFLLLSMTPLAVLVAPGLRALLHRRPVVALVVIGALLLPIASKTARSLRWSTKDPAKSVGRDLQAAGEEQILHDWIRSSTPGDAVFLETRREVTVFGRRSLLVALDEPIMNLQAVSGASFDGVRRRRRLAEALMGTGVLEDGVVDALVREARGRELYVLVRSTALRDRLRAVPGLEPVHVTARSTIFRARGH